MKKEDFEMEKVVIEWLTQNGMEFEKALVVLSLADLKAITLSQAFVELSSKKELGEK